MKILQLPFIFVSLAILFSFGCKKSGNKGPDYTSKMGGIRIWLGTDKGETETGSGLTNHVLVPFDHPFTDTFAMQIINGTTVKGYGGTYTYDHTDSSTSRYVFLNSPNLLSYFYLTNRMAIVIPGYSGLHGWEATFLNTK